MSSRIPFFFMMALAVAFALLVIVQTIMQQKWDEAISVQREYQTRLEGAQRQHQVTGELVRRLAMEAVKNPEVEKVLKQNGINVKMRKQDATGGAN
jgi:hypothetical protein